MKKILVTGADGFIGSHLVEQLMKSDKAVKSFVYYNSIGSRGWLDHAPREIQKDLDVVMGDIRDPRSVREAMRGCDTVVHLASLIAIPYSYHAPKSYVDTNVSGTLNVLEAARDLGIDRLVHTSTSEVYGTAQTVPISEEHPVVGQSPYAATKIAADQLAISFWRSFGVPVVIVRPFNTYGPRQSARAVLPTVITQVLSGVRDIKLGALTPTRDFNFYKDTVSAFESVINSSIGLGEVYNVGSNHEISIRDVVLRVGQIVGVDLSVAVDSTRLRPEKSEVERLVADNRKIKRDFAWSPTFNGIEGFRTGLSETIDWFSNPANMSNYRPSDYTI